MHPGTDVEALSFVSRGAVLIPIHADKRALSATCSWGLSLEGPHEKEEIPLSQVWPSPRGLDTEAPKRSRGPKSLKMG